MSDYASILQLVRQHCYEQKRRTTEYFIDADPLRKGLVAESRFLRALDMLCPFLKPIQAQVCAQRHLADDGRVKYVDFCAEVDKVFGLPQLHEDLLSQTYAPGDIVKDPRPSPDDATMTILAKIGHLCVSRGVVLKNQFEQMDRGDSVSLQNHRYAGKCTRNQFLRCFPFKDECSESDIDLVADYYSTASGDIDFRALHYDVTESEAGMRGEQLPSSPYFRPNYLDAEKWEKGHALEKLRAKCIELRVRLNERFYDFDPLKRGFVTSGQLSTVFSILNVPLSHDEVNEIVAVYGTKDIHLVKVNYKALCADLESGIVYKGIYKTPMLMTETIPLDATRPGRRCFLETTEDEDKEIASIEADVRDVVRKKSILMKEVLSDFDPQKSGVITKNQFFRGMATLGLFPDGTQDESKVNLLAKKYCDRGDREFFNYRKFIREVDPTPDYVLRAEAQDGAIFDMDAQSNEYFTKQGQVVC